MLLYLDAAEVETATFVFVSGNVVVIAISVDSVKELECSTVAKGKAELVEFNSGEKLVLRFRSVVKLNCTVELEFQVVSEGEIVPVDEDPDVFGKTVVAILKGTVKLDSLIELEYIVVTPEEEIVLSTFVFGKTVIVVLKGAVTCDSVVELEFSAITGDTAVVELIEIIVELRVVLKGIGVEDPDDKCTELFVVAFDVDKVVDGGTNQRGVVDLIVYIGVGNVVEDEATGKGVID